MNVAADKLITRVLLWQCLFSTGTAALVGVLAPWLLLLSGDQQRGAMITLFVSVAAAGVVSFLHAALRLRRYRFLVRRLALGSDAIEWYEIAKLGSEAWPLTMGWLVPSILGLAVAAVRFRPPGLDLSTALSLSLLGAVIAAAASLPFYVLVRSDICSAVELAPTEVMAEVLERVERTSRPERRVPQRILAAVATPVLFLVLGSALITDAHLRRAEEAARRETARALALTVLDRASGHVRLDDAVTRALAHGAAQGYHARLMNEPAKYRLTRDESGAFALVLPVGSDSAVVRFRSPTGTVLSAELIAIALAALGVAALMGVLLGRALGADLSMATRAVRLLGTDVVLSGGSVVSQARFRAVASLLRAIERLAVRFRVFAQAQVRAIEAREAATRMRGLIFASVSHDLKSPLNAILGFSELIRQHEVLTVGQFESLQLIERRGRELLALIETILDAARVEAGHLKLVNDLVTIEELLSIGIGTGLDLGAERDVEVISEYAADVPPIHIDRVRMGRALATFIGHAVRSAERPSLRVRATLVGSERVRIEVEVPSRRFSARQLEAMLSPHQQPGTSPNRGLALALGLARSMVELHGGSVHVEDRTSAGVAFVLQLPVQLSFDAASARHELAQ